MNIGVIFSAVSFDVRLRQGDRAYLKQHERFKMAAMLDEIEKWMSETVHVPQLVVVTCFDEIYDLCLARKIRVVKNEFAGLNEENVLRTGLLALPDHKNFILLGSAESKLVKASLFEELCNRFNSLSGRTLVTRYAGNLVFPLLFNLKSLDNVRKILDRGKGRLKIKQGEIPFAVFEATQEFLGSENINMKLRDYLSGTAKNFFTADKRENVALIIGGGRLGTGIALTLFEAGWKVLITERKDPKTIYKGMSFAEAVGRTKYSVNGVTAHLVSPSLHEFEKAWKAGIIPLIIDDGSTEGSFAGGYGFDNTPKAEGGLDPTGHSGSYFDAAPQEKTEKIYNLRALIDASSPSEDGSLPVFPTFDDIASIGIKGRNYKNPPKYLLETSLTSQYSKISRLPAFEPQRTDNLIYSADMNESATSEAKIDPVKTFSPLYEFRASEDGRLRAVKRLGDKVKPGDLLAQIVTERGERKDLISNSESYIIGMAEDGSEVKQGEAVLIMDPAAASAQDAFAQNPLSLLPGYSVQKLLGTLRGS